MKILWLTWKDMRHPLAGGAEVVNEELARRLAQDGHEVRFVVGGFGGGAPQEERDGFSIVRLGGRYSVYWRAWRYYKAHMREWPDIVIDEMNTVPFFAKWYARQRVLLFVHQLCRQIWFYQMRAPASLVGYLLEPLYLRALAWGGQEAVTVSESTKRDLMRYGFVPGRISIISEGIELEPVRDLSMEKYPDPTILALGAIRPMKCTDRIVRAFELLKRLVPNARLVVAGAGEGPYAARVARMIEQSPYRADIECLGKVSGEKKLELLQKSHIIAVTSVKEGWGLIVTEANSQGTPAAVYDVDGLRDSVRDGVTGLVCAQNTPQSLAASMNMLLTNPKRYARLRQAGWEWSREITFERSYAQFKEILQHA
jgi:glycosyltransferase involved in cell wall biosynthesis